MSNANGGLKQKRMSSGQLGQAEAQQQRRHRGGFTALECIQARSQGLGLPYLLFGPRTQPRRTTR